MHLVLDVIKGKECLVARNLLYVNYLNCEIALSVKSLESAIGVFPLWVS